MKHNERHTKPVRYIEHQVAKVFSDSKLKSVLVAVSGGADSVALLCACVRIADRSGIHVEAANCNFHLRGAESDRDSYFTASICKRLGVRLHQLEYDVARYMEEHPGVSTEMACRELRYADFFVICRQENLERVAVAHNADDDIETMMLSLLRGSGTRGLRGMDIDNGKVIRPFLGISRSEIEAYLSALGQDFITDSSNLTSDYLRNFMRRDVLPLLESRWQGAMKSLSKTLSIMKEESEIVETHYRQQLRALCPSPTTLLVYANGVSTGTVSRFLEPYGGNTAIAEEIIRSVGRQYCKRQWKLSERYFAVLERDRLFVSDRTDLSSEPTIVWTRLDMTPELMNMIRKNKSHRIIYLPHGESEYEMRSPIKGDRLAPLGMKGTRLVSDIISDARLDTRHKDAVRVLARRSDGKIVWVAGLKRSSHDLISDDSEYCYKAEWIRTEPIPHR